MSSREWLTRCWTFNCIPSWRPGLQQQWPRGSRLLGTHAGPVQIHQRHRYQGGSHTSIADNNDINNSGRRAYRLMDLMAFNNTKDITQDGRISIREHTWANARYVNGNSGRGNPLLDAHGQARNIPWLRPSTGLQVLSYQHQQHGDTPASFNNGTNSNTGREIAKLNSMGRYSIRLMCRPNWTTPWTTTWTCAHSGRDTGQPVGLLGRT